MPHSRGTPLLDTPHLLWVHPALQPLAGLQFLRLKCGKDEYFSFSFLLAGHRLAVHFPKNGTSLPKFSVHELSFDMQLAAFLALPLVCSVRPQWLSGEPTFTI